MPRKILKQIDTKTIKITDKSRLKLRFSTLEDQKTYWKTSIRLGNIIKTKIYSGYS